MELCELRSSWENDERVWRVRSEPHNSCYEYPERDSKESEDERTAVSESLWNPSRYDGLSRRRGSNISNASSEARLSRQKRP